MHLAWVAVALVVVWVEDVHTRKFYHGCKVFRVSPSVDQQKLMDQFSDKPGFDFWSETRSTKSQLDIMVNPELQEVFREYLQEHHIAFKVIIEDVEKVVSAEHKRQMEFEIHPPVISFQRYYRYDEINNYLEDLSEAYPNLTTVETVGRSFEGRDLNVIKISSGGGGSRPVILIDAGIHAREWIAPAMALYIIQELVENGNNANLVSSVDWHIIPLLNPDGYEYSHTTDRMWRKTRSQRSNSSCYGVDVNRNFGFHWMEVGASDRPCSETYAGPRAFSESESQTLRDYSLSNADRIKLYLTLHSYGQFILYPWGFTPELSSDSNTLDLLAKEANAAQYRAGGSSYTVGSSTNILYAAAGGSDDWEKGVAGVNLSYTIELPGGGDHGFDMPAASIQQHVTHFFEAVRVFGRYVADHF